MFPVGDYDMPKTNDRTIYIYQNACVNNKLLAEVRLSRKRASLSEIAKTIGFNNLRLFNSEGGEYFQQDLQYIKDKTTLYASRGEDFDPSSSFGQYRILKELGEGGFGKVLLGEHKLTGEKVAIKTIKTGTIGSAADIDNVFIEAQILKSLNHENIVKVHNCLSLANMNMAIIMEYLQGGELLAEVQKHGRLTQAEAKVFFKQIVKAMYYCHQNNLIHRDLKLENLLLVNTQEKKIKIIDFGIAGVASHFKIEDMDTGSLNYMAPECFSAVKQRKIDGGVDVWAIGVILYGMLVGDLPFKGNTSQQKIEALRAGQYKIPSNIASEISEECLHCLKRCLDTNPKTRIKMHELTVHPWNSDGFFPQPKIEKKKEQLKPVIEEVPVKEKPNTLKAINPKQRRSVAKTTLLKR